MIVICRGVSIPREKLHFDPETFTSKIGQNEKKYMIQSKKLPKAKDDFEFKAKHLQSIAFGWKNKCLIATNIVKEAQKVINSILVS